jgi:hypothetical protein
MSSNSRLILNLSTGTGKTSAAIRNPVRGQWLNIRLKPDIFSGELFNIGVGFIDNNGTLHSQFTDDLSRLQCLFDDRIDLQEIGLLVDLAASQYDRATFDEVKDKTISPQIILGEPSYASGKTIGSILNQFYDETISLKPFGEDSKTRRPRFASSSTESVRSEVFNWLRLQHPLLAKEIIPSNSQFVIQTSDGGVQQRHTVELPLRAPGRAAGTIVSANCKTAPTAELRILQAAMNINTAVRHLEGEDCGLFILRPGDNSALPRSTLDRFDDLIDESVWKLRDAGVYVGVEDSIEGLGKEIVGWAA